MTFKRRIALLSGVTFLLAVLACSLVGWAVVQRQLLDGIDDDLRDRVNERPLVELALARDARIGPREGNRGPAGLRPRPTDVPVQVVTADGVVWTAPGSPVTMPVDDLDLALLDDRAGNVHLRTVTIDEVTYRVATASTDRVAIVQVGRSLAEVDQTLESYRRALVAVLLVGTVVAVAVGWWVARRAARPVVALAEAAEHVSATGEFDVRLEADSGTASGDEVAQLRSSIAAMLTSLRESRQRQRQLIADASHEFRTPLTSLRANVDLLDHPGLDEPTRAAVVADLRSELAELADLSEDLLELASDRAAVVAPVEVDLVDLVERTVARARRRTDMPIRVEVDAPATVHGDAHLLERALQNLVTNAIRWNEPGATITVRVEGRRIEVCDQGPGIPASERELVFERFWRSDSARGTPGSGLGLAIVAHAARAHHGTVRVEAAEGGGSRFVFEVADATAT